MDTQNHTQKVAFVFLKKDNFLYINLVWFHPLKAIEHFYTRIHHYIMVRAFFTQKQQGHQRGKIKMHLQRPVEGVGGPASAVQADREPRGQHGQTRLALPRTGQRAP